MRALRHTQSIRTGSGQQHESRWQSVGWFGCCTLLLITASVPAEEKPAFEPFRAPPPRQLDILHLKLELDVELAQKRITGTATLQAKPLRPLQTIYLDAVDLDITAVRLAEQPVVFQNLGQQLLILPEQTLAADQEVILNIDYSVTDPKNGLYFFQPTDQTPTVPMMVWSQGEPTSNRYWFPCFDYPNEKQSSELIITTTAGYEVISNGALLAKEELAKGRVRFHWKQEQPHVSYLVTLVVGQFHVSQEKWRHIPVLYYVPVDKAADVSLIFGRTVEMLDLFSEKFGIAYPWEKYAQVVVEQFSWGGMENTSATTLNDRTLVDERGLREYSPDYLIAHELAHQWWGDLVTCEDWAHLWLNEGFASYSEVLWVEHKLGPEEQLYYLWKDGKAARSKSAQERPVVDRFYKAPFTMFDARTYPKGAWILHMLRQRLGDDLFFQCLSQYIRTHAYQSVETADFRRTIERVSQQPWERFFYDWTERPGHPVLELESQYLPEEQLVMVKLKQTQVGLPFVFPLRLEWLTELNSTPIVLEKLIDAKEMQFYLPCPTPPQLMRFDPHFTLLCELKEDKPTLWWENQLSAPTVPERLRAVIHFSKRQTKSEALLSDRLSAEPFWGVRVEIAEALAEVGGESARSALLKALQSDPDARVRTACAAALGQFSRDAATVAALRQILSDETQGYGTIARALVSLAKLENGLPLTELEPFLEVAPFRERVLQVALEALARSRQEAALERLVQFLEAKYPQNVRIRAAELLPELLARYPNLWTRRPRLAADLAETLAKQSVRVRRAWVELLKSFGADAEPALTALEQLRDQDGDTEVRELAVEAITAIRNKQAAPVALTELRTALEKLEQENQRLRDRIDKWESKTPQP